MRTAIFKVGLPVFLYRGNFQIIAYALECFAFARRAGFNLQVLPPWQLIGKQMQRHVLVIVENLSVPFDRRVWQESLALVRAGYKVTVICPLGAGYDTERDVRLRGVRILRYPLTPADAGALSYFREYISALWQTLRLATGVRRESPIDVVHACNPPDIFFIVALALKLFGAKFVFDHHDLVPELYLSRFSRKHRFVYRILRLAERVTFCVADGVISTNESYQAIAVERGGKSPHDVTVVRSAPDLNRFITRVPDPGLRRGKPYLLAYLGVMGPQDGVDYALRALQELRDHLGREDFHCIFMGAGDAFDEMKSLAKVLGIEDVAEFTGRVPDEFVQQCLSSADVCLSPDPANPLNSLSTMNKVVEYMAMSRPIVSFDLKEARASAGHAAVYVPANDILAFAQAIDDLLNDPESRRQMGEIGRRRVEGELSWATSERNLISFYERLFASR